MSHPVFYYMIRFLAGKYNGPSGKYEEVKERMLYAPPWHVRLRRGVRANSQFVSPRLWHYFHELFRVILRDDDVMRSLPGCFSF